MTVNDVIIQLWNWNERALKVVGIIIVNKKAHSKFLRQLHFLWNKLQHCTSCSFDFVKYFGHLNWQLFTDFITGSFFNYFLCRWLSARSTSQDWFALIHHLSQIYYYWIVFNIFSFMLFMNCHLRHSKMS